MPKAGRIPNQRPWARSLSGSLLGMTLLALRPCDLAGFNPRQYFRCWLHRRNLSVVVRPKIEILAGFVRGPSIRITMYLCVPLQLRIKCPLLILLDALPMPFTACHLDELTFGNCDLVNSLGLETARRTLAGPRTL